MGGPLLRDALVPLLLRLGLATVFIYHGIDGIRPENHYGASWRPSIAVPDPLKVPAQLAVAWGQLVGGAALAVGLFPRVAAGGLALIVAGCVATVTGRYGFKSTNQGWEYDFVLLVVCAAVLLLGGGPLGLGRWLGPRRLRS
jgi:putative oxidoreductase